VISKELAQQIRYIQLTARRAVDNVFAGEYASVFRGNGIEFHDVREYYPGDEIRTIDWNVTARTGRPQVKRFVEERELTVVFVVDVSASGSFGSTAKSKTEIAAEFTALIAFAAIRHNDRVGLLAFTDHVELFIPPKKGTTHALRLVRELLYFRPRQVRTDLPAALAYLRRVVPRRATVFLVSDFLAADYEHSLRLAAARHDVVAVSVADSVERELPPVGLIDLQDLETGTTVTVDASSRRVRRAYRQATADREGRLHDVLRRAGVDHIALEVGSTWVHELVRFFKAREKRGARAA
jgi:uncharacterized protein (DUF58 family)